jgi:quinol-cytochrome oxidoreductase complex cytochrome b subunit
MLPRKIKSIDTTYIINKLNIPNVDKREFKSLIKWYFLCFYDITKATRSDVKLGGNIKVVVPMFKKNNKNL